MLFMFLEHSLVITGVCIALCPKAQHHEPVEADSTAGDQTPGTGGLPVWR